MKKDGWHYPELGEYPEPVKLNEWESYNPLVLVFMYRYDDQHREEINRKARARYRAKCGIKAIKEAE